MKLCRHCKIDKPFSEFYSHTGGKDGLRGVCKDCWSQAAKVVTTNLTQEQREERTSTKTRWAQNNPEKIRAQNLRRQYKMSIQDYDNLLLKQGGGCAICGATAPTAPALRSLHVDHDHTCCPWTENGVTCGKCIRGILCGACNHGIGKFKDNPILLLKASKYLTDTTH